VQCVAGSGEVQQLVKHGNGDSVHESQTTELEISLEPGDWRVPLINYLKDTIKTGDRKFGK
jgi:hypothetical protein